jgi:iron complex outermembrane recepter protein
MIARSLSAALLAASALTAVPALAQDAPTDEATPANELDPIIVTANRRAENLQDVPVSAAALDRDAVQTILDGGGDITALAARVPGLFVESSNGRAAPRFYIRGLGNTDFDLAASQPVSVVMDDVVMENVTLKAFPLFDVARVEVLRGPQGTLFGRNTPAGIVKIDTNRPTEAFSAQGSLTYGSYNSIGVDFGVGGAIAPGIAAFRISGLWQHRDDWVDNGFTGEDYAYGGYDEFAGRAQLLLTPMDGLEILGSAQYRNLDGTSTLFRANILGPGNNELNANYDRDTVFYDAGGGNPSEYEAFVGTLNVAYDAGWGTLTSITAYAHSEGLSRGDIDGGFGAAFLPVSGPGLIPFPSDTQDSLELDQWTQEVRLASNATDPFGWQVGAFFFSSNFDVTTVGFTFPPPVTVNHTNQSWAVFGQGSVQLSPLLRLTAGLRYTDDEKQFRVLSGAAPQPRSVEDDRLTWDLSAFADVSDDISLFARIASGFRAPTIQGRDVAFFAPPSIATSETIMSYEAGFKSQFAGNRARINGAVFYYTIDDPQFSAVGGAGNLVQLVNAAGGRGFGFEIDSEFKPTQALLLSFGASYNDTRIEDPNLLVGTCAQCTVTDPTVTIGGARRARVDGNPFPNAPEWIIDAGARLGFPMGNDAEFFAATDWAYQGRTNFFLYESEEFFADSQIEGGLRLGYAKLDGSFELAAFVRNITDADNVKGGIDFNNNTAFVNEPRIIGVSLRVKR